MSCALVVHTTLSASAAADFLQATFDIPSPVSCRLVNRGFNDVYRVVASPPLFLRLGRHGRRSVADADGEGSALAGAHAAGAPVAVALRGRDGRFGQCLTAPEGERAALLFAAAAGSGPEDTPAHARGAGPKPGATARSPIER